MVEGSIVVMHGSLCCGESKGVGRKSAIDQIKGIDRLIDYRNFI
jgi:hypothetical protein